MGDTISCFPRATFFFYDTFIVHPFGSLHPPFLRVKYRDRYASAWHRRDSSVTLGMTSSSPFQPVYTDFIYRCVDMV